jgi:hypothetical protein
MTARVRRSSSQVSCDLAGEVVILSLPEGFYYSLDAVGARIWCLVSEAIAVSALHARIVGEFEVSDARCRADILGFLDELRSRGLIDVATAAPDHREERR